MKKYTLSIIFLVSFLSATLCQSINIQNIEIDKLTHFEELNVQDLIFDKSGMVFAIMDLFTSEDERYSLLLQTDTTFKKLGVPNGYESNYEEIVSAIEGLEEYTFEGKDLLFRNLLFKYLPTVGNYVKDDLSGKIYFTGRNNSYYTYDGSTMTQQKSDFNDDFYEDYNEDYNEAAEAFRPIKDVLIEPITIENRFKLGIDNLCAEHDWEWKKYQTGRHDTYYVKDTVTNKQYVIATKSILVVDSMKQAQVFYSGKNKYEKVGRLDNYFFDLERNLWLMYTSAGSLGIHSYILKVSSNDVLSYPKKNCFTRFYFKDRECNLWASDCNGITKTFGSVENKYVYETSDLSKLYLDSEGVIWGFFTNFKGFGSIQSALSPLKEDYYYITAYHNGKWISTKKYSALETRLNQGVEFSEDYKGNKYFILGPDKIYKCQLTK